jgi:hypothetical protein
MHTYEVRPRKDDRGFDLISEAPLQLLRPQRPQLCLRRSDDLTTAVKVSLKQAQLRFVLNSSSRHFMISTPILVLNLVEIFRYILHSLGSPHHRTQAFSNW